jgi:hypothetical protein
MNATFALSFEPRNMPIEWALITRRRSAYHNPTLAAMVEPGMELTRDQIREGHMLKRLRAAWFYEKQCLGV